jgi:hypothetical protein
MSEEQKGGIGPIDLTPTWGAFGNLYRHFAEEGNAAALRELRPELAKALAAAQALQAIRATLTDEQAETVAKTLALELARQGY